MKHKQLTMIVILVLFASALSVAIVDAQGPTGGKLKGPRTAMETAFTYQGQLKQNGNLISGNCDFLFGLWGSQSGGAQIGTNQSKPNISVSSGLFTVQLDFGATAFDGNPRYLDIQVSCPTNSGLWAPLSPRQPLTPAPYSLFAAQGPFWSLSGNAGTSPSTHFIGTTDNAVLEFRVNNTRVVRLEPDATSPNLVGGYSGNAVNGGIHGATIGGGGASTYLNRVTDDYGFVGGGLGNQAGNDSGTTSDAPYGTVAGGFHNTASAYYASVGGGNTNVASYGGATVAGGEHNTASAGDATVAGGMGNTASGSRSTVPGGMDAVASHYGEMAMASGKFQNAGDAQTSTYVLRGTTTGTVPSYLYPDGYGDYRLTIPNGHTVTFDVLVVARQNSTANSAGFQLRGVVKNVNTLVALVGIVNKTVLGQDQTWDVDVSTSGATQSLEIRVVGSGPDPIRWVATVRTAEVQY